MQTYRRLASTASSTSRSASTSMSHHGGHAPTAMSRSSSTTTNESNPRSGLSLTMPPPSGLARGLASPSSATTSTRSPSTPYGTLSSSNLNLAEYTPSELHTIAESLLAHVTFGPYHIASSPVPSSHMHTLLAASQSSRNKENLASSSTSISSSSTTSILGPSARRQFEGKEGSRNVNANGGSNRQGLTSLANVAYPPLTPFGASASSSSASTPRSNHPRARFTIGAPESERGRGARRGATDENSARGRGMGRTISRREREASSSELWELDEEDGERGRSTGGRGRRGDVKILQQ
ncbi:hypothetical protein M408DRAFT_24077 [Serendipita vermifera MAFF 305830]|uniref:Uncharacterized protein n=1 Tax=Serendipita vermifera MAFF 305830 TaxID=933852 RepID=A0A0C2XG53_SERVB|nr:hypothetical protein M408DRAFT_24077 [Serendipita vermifera MAFF 305830]